MILDYLNSRKSDLVVHEGAVDDMIQEAQNELELSFSSDYIDVLKRYGQILFDCHELTGISDVDRVNVVKTTTKQWENNPFVPHDLYVIEDLGIDKIIIWQGSDGTVYSSQVGSAPIRIANDLLDYLTE